MSSKHTPGPWVVDGSKITTTGKDRDRVRIAKTLPNNAFGMDETQTANAHLIAAAPEMYEALKQTQAALTYFIDSVEEQVDQKIRGERKKFSFNDDLVQSFEEALSAQEIARAVIAKAKIAAGGH